MKEDKVVNIENWSIQEKDNNPFMAPELRSKMLCGNVYNHPRIEDGKYVHTSSIQNSADLDLTNGTVKTMNTTYQLGKIDEKYLEYCEEHNIKDLELIRKYKGAEDE